MYKSIYTFVDLDHETKSNHERERRHLKGRNREERKTCNMEWGLRWEMKANDTWTYRYMEMSASNPFTLYVNLKIFLKKK